jgi:class 3 adenylate cyclase/ActR/RegA family two-component response regulator
VTDIRVVLCDDNVLVREGVRALLDATDGIEVAGVASDGPTLLAAADEHRPDVVVTDIKMPPSFQLEGINAAHTIRQRHPDTGVVVLSAHDDEEYAIALLGSGQSGLGYLLKDRLGEGDELERAIREVAAGGSLVDPTIAEKLAGRGDTAGQDLELLDLMGQGLGYTDIAQRLGTTPEGVDRRVTEMFGRLASGGASAVDQLKRLHAAVVDREAAARKLSEFLPGGVADRLAGDLTDLQEEVEATMLFSDIRGFSAVAERTAPRELAAILATHLSAMAEVVLSHGGTVDKFGGDAVMAVFGVPNALPDHAERAIRCAMAMHDRQRELNEEAQRDGRDPLEIGIGVNTGIVMAGTLGGGGRREYTVIGDAVNIAQRLQSAASGGETVIAASTMAGATGIDAEPAGALEVKGRVEPVEAFRLGSPA